MVSVNQQNSADLIPLVSAYKHIMGDCKFLIYFNYLSMRINIQKKINIFKEIIIIIYFTI